jgi:NAD+ synthetase
MVEDFEKYLRPIQSELTLENLQARIRGLVMMAESNDRNALLLTNGNETEIALGYSTLYGDMAGGLSVIGGLNKPDVYRLARHTNQRSGREIIPEGTFTLEPSAELSEGQVDPFDYEVVGPLVSTLIEGGVGPEQLVQQFQDRSLDQSQSLSGDAVYDRYSVEQFQALVEDLFRRLNRSVYKRLQGAPIVVVSGRAFGFDLRETIINGWRG